MYFKGTFTTVYIPGEMARDVTILSMNCRGLAGVEKRNEEKIQHLLFTRNSLFRRNTQSDNLKMGI